MIKLFLTFVWNLFAQLALARAAGILVRQGRKQEALNLMNQR
jgi:hypothetical protein